MLKEFNSLIEKHLEKLLPKNEGPCSLLYNAARYSVLGGGKRLRPMLTLAANQALKGDIQQALTPACAIEIIHAYSLIHDDLPCMDNDDFRRGKLTLHRAYSEGHAILTGDFLLTYAFELLANDKNLSAEQKILLIATLAKHGGGEGMIGGQVLDIDNENKQIEIDLLNQIHRKKTGALITAAIEFGGIIANAPKEIMQLLLNLGGKIGLAFQIIDDVLDVVSSEEKHGRKIATDQINKKTTYVSLLGVEESKERALKLQASAMEILQQLPGNTSSLSTIIQLITN